MKLGFVSSILDGWSFEEVIDIAGKMGYKCVEVACWPKGVAERRYAGVSHIDIESLDDEKVKAIRTLCHEKDIEISSLAYYSNPLDGNEEVAANVIEHLKKVILAAEKLEVGMVTTFIGKNQYKTAADNLELVKKVWPPIVNLAEEHHVRIGIENCPMLFTKDEWPGGKNLMTSPEMWRKIFEILPNDNFGINFDPSHFVWQMMDYVKPIYEFKDKIFHIHIKDLKVLSDRLNEVGILAYPLEFMVPKLPGLGDVNWGRFISALTDIGYDGYACVEVEDRSFETSKEKILESLALSKKYIDQYII